MQRRNRVEMAEKVKVLKTATIVQCEGGDIVETLKVVKK